MLSNIKRLFRAGPFDDFSYEDLKRLHPAAHNPEHAADFNQRLLTHLRADRSRFPDYAAHIKNLETIEQADVAKAEKAIADEGAAQQQAAQQAHIDASNQKMRNIGQDALIASGGLGLGLYGGKKVYDSMHKQGNEGLLNGVAAPLSEEQIQTLRLMSLTPEQRALYMQVNPAGVPKMAENTDPTKQPLRSPLSAEKLKALNDLPKKHYNFGKVQGIREEEPTAKEAGIRDFVSRHLGRKSEEFIQGRKALDVAAKAKTEQDLLNAYAKKRGLNMSPTGEIGSAPKPGFLQRNKWPLGIAAAGAGGLYLMNQQDKMGAYNETLCRLGLSKLAVKIPPIPFKAKSQAAKQGKPFFTPSQAEKAKKLEGPAAVKAPWEEVKTSFDRGYLQTLNLLKLAGKADIVKRMGEYASRKAERGAGTTAAKAVSSPNPVANKMQSYLSGGAVGVKPTPKANMQSYLGASLHQPTAAPAPAAKPSIAAADKMRAYTAPKPAVTPEAPPAAVAPQAAATSAPKKKTKTPAAQKTPKAPAAEKKPGLLDKAKGYATKAQEQYGALPTWGKGMVLGGGGLGLLGGGMGLGSALASPDVVVH